MTYVSEVLADNPIGYWRLGEVAGPTTVSEVNSPALDGTAVAGPTFGEAGALTASGDNNTAVSFTTVQRIDFTNNVLFQVGDTFTIEAWVKRTVVGANFPAIASQAANSFQIGFNPGNEIYVAKRGVAFVAHSSVTVADANYHHVVYTKNGAANAIYLDGVDVTILDGNQVMVASNQFWIAATGPAADFWEGTLDEVALYGTALSAARVLDHYNAAINPPPVPIPLQPQSLMVVTGNQNIMLSRRGTP